jgi:TonB family protein
MNFLFKLSIAVFVIFFFPQVVFGQDQKLKGKVVDEKGNPVAYASIRLKGSNNPEKGTVKGFSKEGTWTNKEGKYSIAIPRSYDSIICTHVNFKEKSEAIEGNSIINLVLDENKTTPITNSISAKYKAKAIGNKEQRINDDKKAIIIKEIFEKIEVNANFPGGEKKIKEFLNKEIVFSDSSFNKSIKGVVKVGLIIGTDGGIKNVTLLKGVDTYVDEMVLKAVQKFPKWKPAIQNGIAVEQYKEIAISFDISVEEN